MILNRFTLEDWEAFLEGYAGNLQELIQEIKKNPEAFEDDINGASMRRASIQKSEIYFPSGREGSYVKMKPLDGSGFYRMMNHKYTA